MRLRPLINFDSFLRVNQQWMHCLFIVLFSLITFSLVGCHSNLQGVLDPRGIVAQEERQLFFDTLALMLIVVLPVIVMSFAFVYHYRASHRYRPYKPNWSHSVFLESLWWGIPCIIILVLAILTWKKTHRLDPYNQIVGVAPPSLLIQGIALPWKWLFIYPAQNIATVNYLVLPVNQQVEFWLTTDNVPMSAFFIPQLGSQIYTMTGMRTRLHLYATHTGLLTGMNTLYNGDGFSDMRFPVYVVEPEALQSWFGQIKKMPNQLTESAYSELLKPVINAKPVFFSGVTNDLFKQVIHLYMHSLGTVHPRQEQNQGQDAFTPKNAHIY